MAKRVQKKKSVAQAPSPPHLIPPPGVASVAASWREWWPQAALIAALTLWIYGPALSGGWVWDDTLLITDNPLNRSLAGLAAIWTQPGKLIDYYPITFSVQWLEWQFWGQNTLGYHLTTVALHFADALLVWRLLAKFGLRLAWLGGLLFAVHPVQVESVAWISELKNTLSLLFFLLAMISYLDYAERATRRDYLWSLGFFAAAMLSKTTMLTFPVSILLYHWWKEGRITPARIKAALPFFAISLALGALSIGLNRVPADAATSFVPLGVLSRLALAGVTLSFYLTKVFVPMNPLPVYPQWTVDPTSLPQLLPWPILAGLLVWFWSNRKSWGRHALLGVGFFLIMIGPFLGLVTAPNMNFTWVMDHFLYIPAIGMIGLLCAALGQLPEKGASRWALIVGSAIAVLLLAGESRAYARSYASNEIFWTYVAEHNPGAWIAHQNLGDLLMGKGQSAAALDQFDLALAQQPNASVGEVNRGTALVALGRSAEAEADFRHALKMNPNNANAHLSLGELLHRAGDAGQAETLFRDGLKIAPDDASMATDLAAILMESKRVPEAIDLYQYVVELNPDVAQMQYNLGAVLLQNGGLGAAIDHLSAAVTLDPGMAQAHENLGSALAQSGRLPEAITQFEAAVQIKSDYVIARSNLALALSQTGQIPAAIDQFKKILELDPNNAKARDALANLQQFEMQHNAPGSR